MGIGESFIMRNSVIYIIHLIKSRRLKWAGYVVGMMTVGTLPKIKNLWLKDVRKI